MGQDETGWSRMGQDYDITPKKYYSCFSCSRYCKWDHYHYHYHFTHLHTQPTLNEYQPLLIDGKMFGLLIWYGKLQFFVLHNFREHFFMYLSRSLWERKVGKTGTFLNDILGSFSSVQIWFSFWNPYEIFEDFECLPFPQYLEMLLVFLHKSLVPGSNTFSSREREVRKKKSNEQQWHFKLSIFWIQKLKHKISSSISIIEICQIGGC